MRFVVSHWEWWSCPGALEFTPCGVEVYYTQEEAEQLLAAVKGPGLIERELILMESGEIRLRNNLWTLAGAGLWEELERVRTAIGATMPDPHLGKSEG